ncbi:MAG: hypothetical protein ACYCQI_10860 [Gammaproteobacteria bacterium]
MHGVKHRSTVYILAGFASIILSIWAAMRSAVINPDAICYLQSADSMMMGLTVAIHLCDQAHWPFYSALIFGLASVTKLSYLHSAYVIDGFFSLLSVITFLMLVRFLKGSNRILWFAAFVILLAHEFNVVREDIIRDHGFWAFYLLSILFLLRFFHKPAWCYALLWSACGIVATLFRIEGVVFLIVLPVIALLIPGRRLRNFLQLYTLPLLGIIGLGIWLGLHPQISTDHLGRVGEIKFQLLHGFSSVVQNFQITSQKIAQAALNQYSKHDAGWILFLVLLSWYVINVVGNLTLIYALLVVYAWWRHALALSQSARFVLWGYVIINILITCSFLAEHMFLSKRYLVALSLTLMLWVPFALESLYQKCKYSCALVGLLILISGLGGIVSFGYSKQYIRDAGEWLEKNVPQNATLFSNNYQVMYYSQRFGHDIFLKSREYSAENILVDSHWKKYDYIALRLNKHEVANIDAVTKELGQPIQIFSNKRGDEVAIYKTH